jgi:hypothetical protein
LIEAMRQKAEELHAQAHEADMGGKEARINGFLAAYQAHQYADDLERMAKGLMDVRRQLERVT